MILKGSQRGGTRQLAAHLLNDRDNDHIVVEDLRGFVSESMVGAMAEAHAVSRGTRCRQPVFSLSLNPPEYAQASVDTLLEAADRAETALGLSGQPRAIVIHEKNGRRHAHVVWSRIDAEEMKAINLPHYKNRLRELSKELYLEHGWELPEGHRTNGWKNPLNFTLAEWQQAKRLELDPREIKQVFQEAWQRSDGLPAFRAAMEEHGYYLARGDRRGVVALDIQGEVFSVARWAGVKTRDLNARLGKDAELPGVEDVRGTLRKQVTQKLRGYLREDRQAKQTEFRPLLEERQTMVTAQRAERALLERRQAERLRTENKERAGKFRRGLGVVMDILTLRLFAVRKENEREAYAGYVRDRAQRERLFAAQNSERKELQARMDAMQARHRADRMRLARRIAQLLHHTPAQEDATRTRTRERDLDFEM